MRIVTQKTIKFVFSYYVRWQRGTARIRLPHADRAAIDQYILPTGPTAANPQQQCAAVGWDGGTDRQTDARQLRRPCSAYYARGANNDATVATCAKLRETVTRMMSTERPTQVDKMEDAL